MISQQSQSDPRLEKLQEAFVETRANFLAEIEQDQNDLLNKNASLLKAIKENGYKLMEFEEKIPVLEAQLAKQEAEIEELNQQKAGKAQELKAIESDTRALLSNKEKLNLEVGQAKQTIEAAAKKLSDLEDQKKRLTAENKALNKEQLELEVQIKEQLDSAKNELERLKAQNEDLRHQNIGLGLSIEERKKQLENADIALQNTSKETVAKQKKLEDKLNEVSSLESKKSVLMDEILNLEEKIRSEEVEFQRHLAEQTEKLDEERVYVQKAKEIIEQKQKDIEVVTEELQKKISSVLLLDGLDDKNKKELTHLLSVIGKI